jgi:hypothetical protein
MIHTGGSHGWFGDWDSRIKRRKSGGWIGLEYNVRPRETEAQAACLVAAIR